MAGACRVRAYAQALVSIEHHAVSDMAAWRAGTQNAAKTVSRPPAPPRWIGGAPRGRVRCPPCASSLLSCERVDHASANHHSGAVFEHSRRSGAQELEAALVLAMENLHDLRSKTMGA